MPPDTLHHEALRLGWHVQQSWTAPDGTRLLRYTYGGNSIGLGFQGDTLAHASINMAPVGTDWTPILHHLRSVPTTYQGQSA